MTVHKSIPCSRSPLLRLLAIVPLFTVLLAGCTEEDNPAANDDHFEPEGLVILNAQGDTVVYYFQGVLRAGDTLKAPTSGLSSRFTITFLDSTGRNSITPSSTLKLGWTIADPGIAAITRQEGEEYVFQISGTLNGTTTITFMLLHGDHADFTTRPIPVLVDPGLVAPRRPQAGSDGA